MEVASTKIFNPSTSMTLSIIPAPFSNDMEYEKPEHPPPTTPTRNPAGTGFCCAMISFTLATAFGVILTGLVLVGVPIVGVSVVAIPLLLVRILWWIIAFKPVFPRGARGGEPRQARA